MEEILNIMNFGVPFKIRFLTSLIEALSFIEGWDIDFMSSVLGNLPLYYFSFLFSNAGTNLQKVGKAYALFLVGRLIKRFRESFSLVGFNHSFS